MSEQANVEPEAAAEKKTRGMTGYMFFLQRNREAFKLELDGAKGVKEITKLAAERWRALSEEEKAKWNADGKLAPVAEKINRPSAAAISNASTIPLSKVREICKKDAEVKAINGEAVILLASAAERFLQELLQTSLEKSTTRKQIKLVDVHHAIHLNDEKFGFLVYDFAAPAQIEAREFQANKLKRLAREQERAAAANSSEEMNKNQITEYFASFGKRSKVVVDEDDKEDE